MDEIIETRLIWHDESKEKPKIGKQVLIRIESYYEEDLRGKGFTVGYWKRDPHRYESWFYLDNVTARRMGYVWKATYWAYLPDTILIDNLDDRICSRSDILDL